MNIGSLFSGAGGLDMAVEHVFGGNVVWHCEQDKAASKVLAHRWPNVPNLGDITAVDWTAVEPVDVLCGGFPCTDVSAAGKRAGIAEGTRSGLWSEMAVAIGVLRPSIVIIENVRGLLSARAHRNVESADTTLGNKSERFILRAAGAVLGDLADLGYDAQWTTVAAGDVGAPHRRERVFVVAYASRAAVGMFTGGSPSQEAWSQSGDRFGNRDRKQPDVDLLPTPVAMDSVGARNATSSRQPDSKHHSGTTLTDVLWQMAAVSDAPLLPTPAAGNFNDGEDAQQWLARQAAVKDRIKNGNGMGMPLSVAVQLLPTPLSGEARHGSPNQHRTNGDKMLTGVVLCEIAPLLCTPSASGGAGGKTSRSGGRIDEPLLGGQAREMHTNWGKYAPAIRRWESLTRPAPAPTEPNKNGNPRLSAAFSQWLMGWPDGWVTDAAIGISRNDQLRIVGNGVCPQQAVAALEYLLGVCEAVA